MNPEVFAEWLRRQGRSVVRTQSSYWFNMGPRTLQAFPYHWLIEPEEEELSQVLRTEKAIALRYSTPLTGPEGCVSYHMIYDKPSYELSDVRKKSRSLVRAGLQACKVGPISHERYAAEGWRMQLDTMKRQKRHRQGTEKGWRQMVMAASTLDGFEVWGAEVGGELGACVFFVQIDDCVSILFQQSYTHLLPLHVNNALAFALTQNLLQRPQVRVINYGVHSLDAPSSVDEFKLNMGYKARPLRQRVCFHPWTPSGVVLGIHSTLDALLPRKPQNSMFAKFTGIIRLYALGKVPLFEQEFPELLSRGQKEPLEQLTSAGIVSVPDLPRQELKVH
jgi:hypothetical protein